MNWLSDQTELFYLQYLYASNLLLQKEDGLIKGL
jgi:hypothetical protein